MKKISKLMAVLVIAVLLCTALAACDNTPPDVPPDGTVALVSEGTVNFRIVKTSELGSAGVKAVSSLISKLASLGLEVGEAVSDKDAEAVSDCEIIIGTGAQNRGDDCNIGMHTLGKDGYVIKVVGTRLIVAGGSDDAIESAVDVLLDKVFGVGSQTESLSGATVSVASDTLYKKGTEYDVTDIRLTDDGISLSAGYYLSYDASDAAAASAAQVLRSGIYEASGIWLPLASAAEGAERLVIVRSVADAGEAGFRAFIDDGGNLSVECSYADDFKKGTEKFIGEYIEGQTGIIRIFSDILFEYNVNAVRYTEFGAKGDGKTDDSLAIFAAHEYANENGMRVVEDEGLTYYMGSDSFGLKIPVMTDVDLGEAKIIIDDRYVTPDAGKAKYRARDIFNVVPSEACEGYELSPSDYSGVSLSVGDTNIGMTFATRVMLHISYEGQKVYIRYGANANSGSATNEQIIVAANGDIDPTTPLTFNYPELSSVTVYSLDETPITLKGGIFTTYANRLCYSFEEGSSYITGDQYYYYGRGISITRSNVTVEGLEHYVEKEGDGGYPYSGFISVSSCANVLISNCIVTAHRAYVEDRDTDGDGQPNTDKGTIMGSYDLNVNTAINVTFKNVKQSNSITSNFYWGIMGSNYARNIVYDGCYLSRFDAHCGVYNATIKDTTIGMAINLTGDGTFIIENVIKLTGADMITLREGYGSTWNGSIYVNGITMLGYKRKSFAECDMTSRYTEFNLLEGKWYEHDFGNRCYLPSYIEINGIVAESAERVNIFNYSYLTADSFTSQINPIQLSDSMALRVNCDVSGFELYFTSASTDGYLDSLLADGTITERTSGTKKIKVR